MNTGDSAARAASGTFDVEMDADWRKFRAQLADVLADLSVGGRTLVRARSGFVPGQEFLWGEVHRRDHGLEVTVPSNTYLPHRVRMTAGGMRTVRAMGLRRAHSSADYQCELPASHVDQAASILCTALRECFGVLHPVWLEVPGTALDRSDDGLAEPSLVPLAVMPRDHAHLTALLDDGISRLDGQVNISRGEDNWAVWNDEAMVSVSISRDAPIIELEASVICEFERASVARHQVNELNRRHRGVTFSVDDDNIVAQLQLIAYPFSAYQLAAGVQQLLEAVTAAAEQLLPRVGGESFASIGAPKPGVEELAATLVAMLAAGPLSPRQVISLCHNDPDLIIAVRRLVQDNNLDWSPEGDGTRTAMNLLGRAARLALSELPKPRNARPKPRNARPKRGQ